jgi:hypothetical protein
MPYGFSMHIVCGRIGYIKERTAAGNKVVNLSVCAKIFPRRKDQEEVSWYEMSIWGRDALNFLKCGFSKGDELAFSATNLRASLWSDRFGNSHASLSGSIDRFWDARIKTNCFDPQRVKKAREPYKIPFSVQGGYPSFREMEASRNLLPEDQDRPFMTEARDQDRPFMTEAGFLPAGRDREALPPIPCPRPAGEKEADPSFSGQTAPARKGFLPSAVSGQECPGQEFYANCLGGRQEAPASGGPQARAEDERQKEREKEAGKEGQEEEKKETKASLNKEAAKGRGGRRKALEMDGESSSQGKKKRGKAIRQALEPCALLEQTNAGPSEIRTPLFEKRESFPGPWETIFNDPDWEERDFSNDDRKAFGMDEEED